MNSTTQYSDRECTSKPGENKLNDGSDTTVSHDKENDSSSHSNEEKKGSSFNGRGRGRGGFRGRGRGRGRDFNGNNNRQDNNNNIDIPENASSNLFVKGINFEANEDDLKETFSKYGNVISCKILKDKETKKSKGVGFVNFADKKSATCALNDADNLICKGRNIQCRYAEDKEGEFKGKKGTSFNREDNGNNRGRGGRDRGNRGGRGGFRGGKDDRGRGRGRGGRGGFRGGNRNNDRNNDKDDWNSNNKEEDNNKGGWGSVNDRERSRSKENNNDNAW